MSSSLSSNWAALFAVDTYPLGMFSAPFYNNIICEVPTILILWLLYPPSKVVSFRIVKSADVSLQRETVSQEIGYPPLAYFDLF